MPSIPSLLDDLPALVAAPGGGVAAQHGDTRRLGFEEARRLFRSGNVLVAHRRLLRGV